LFIIIFIIFCLLLFSPNGKAFEVPSYDISIPTPKVGDIVSFSSESQARRELPVSPKIYKIRTDVSWADVLLSYFTEQQHLNGTRWEEVGKR
jgi:hypothetical protein